MHAIVLDKAQAVCHSPQMNPNIPTPIADSMERTWEAGVVARLERDRAILRAAMEKIVADYGAWAGPGSQCVEIARAALEATKDQP